MEPFIIISHKDSHESYRCGYVDETFPEETKFGFFDDKEMAAKYIAGLNQSKDRRDESSFQHNIIFAKQIGTLAAGAGETMDFDGLSSIWNDGSYLYDTYHRHDAEYPYDLDKLREEIFQLAGEEDVRMTQEREERERKVREQKLKEEEEKRKKTEAEAKVKKEKDERELFERLKQKFEPN